MEFSWQYTLCQIVYGIFMAIHFMSNSIWNFHANTLYVKWYMEFSCQYTLWQISCNANLKRLNSRSTHMEAIAFVHSLQTDTENEKDSMKL